jgi:hypothetical protein
LSRASDREAGSAPPALDPGRELLTQLRAAASSAQVVVYAGSITPERSGIASEVDAFIKKDQDIAYLVDLLGVPAPPGPSCMTDD